MTAATDDADLFEICKECGAPLDRGVRYPVSVRDGEDGPIQLFSFCGAACQAAWETRSGQ